MAPKAKRKAPDTPQTQEIRRVKSTVDEAFNQLVCPISLALPVDPVTAMDGLVYERSAIKEWFSKGNGKSPLTNLPIGTTLLSAPHVKSMIEQMVKAGMLTGDKVEAWKTRLDEEKELRLLIEAAKGGDAHSMITLGLWHKWGRNVDQVRTQADVPVKPNYEEAVRWFQQAADHGSELGCLWLGDMYLDGTGVEMNVNLGMLYKTEAAGFGRADACFEIGTVFAQGKHGLRKDVKQAARWYRKLVGLDSPTCSPSERDQAASWLRENAAAV